jgi:hypothetical protein
MHLSCFHRLAARLDDAPGELGLSGNRLMSVGDEDRIVDNRDRRLIAADAEPQYLAQLISLEFIKTVERKFTWLKCPGASRGVYRTAIGRSSHAAKSSVPKGARTLRK